MVYVFARFICPPSDSSNFEMKSRGPPLSRPAVRRCAMVQAPCQPITLFETVYLAQCNRGVVHPLGQDKPKQQAKSFQKSQNSLEPLILFPFYSVAYLPRSCFSFSFSLPPTHQRVNSFLSKLPLSRSACRSLFTVDAGILCTGVGHTSRNDRGIILYGSSSTHSVRFDVAVRLIALTLKANDLSPQCSSRTIASSASSCVRSLTFASALVDALP